jgi:hypothetical protein
MTIPRIDIKQAILFGTLFFILNWERGCASKGGGSPSNGLGVDLHKDAIDLATHVRSENSQDSITYYHAYLDLLLNADRDYIRGCRPDTIYVGDTLEIFFNIPHGADILIVRPDSIDVLLDHIPFSIPDRERMMRRYDFAKTDVLHLPTSYQTEYPFTRGKKTIFDQNGRYRIFVMRTAESEDPAYDECSVTYLHKKR